MDDSFGVASGYVVSDEAQQNAESFIGLTAGSSDPGSCPDADMRAEELD
jgi:hypothetical protein